MEKPKYQTPTMLVVKLTSQTPLLQASITGYDPEPFSREFEMDDVISNFELDDVITNEEDL